MSALARYFLSARWTVSGSDISPSEITDELKKEGIQITIGHKPIAISKLSGLVIYNQAIIENNPELRAARKAGLPCRSYPEMIGELTKKYKTIAIAGAHGKSTTTGMTALVLIEAGMDPTVILGTKLKEFRNPLTGSGSSNFRRGNSGLLVLEADEFGGAFWHYFPAVAVITNVDKEHLDFYNNLTNVKKSFEKFKTQCGTVVSAVKDKKILDEITRVLKVPGQHNVYNASCAYAVAKYLGIPHKIILRGLGKYTGAWRRMEFRGDFGYQVSGIRYQAKVYDDYAHHPTEIKATLAAFREQYPKNRLICVFQPHQEERLKTLFKSFLGAFQDADKVIVLPTYHVAGREDREKRIEKSDLSARLAKAIDAIYVQHPQKELKPILKKLISKYYPLFSRNDFIVAMMGAGDIVKYTNRLLKQEI